MKKIFALIAVAIAGFSAHAQPNPGFESWTTIPFTSPPVEDPTGFASANELKNSFVDPANPQSAFKVTSPDVQSGAFALKLVTVDIITNPDPVNIADPFHYCFTGGAALASTPPYFFGFAYTARPANFTFYSKYTPVGSDSAFCWVVLQKWNTVTMVRDTIAEGFWGTVSASSTYSLNTITMFYNSPTLFPDTAVIIFSSSAEINPQVGSTLYVDDMNFSGTSSIPESSAVQNVEVFPNPATDNIRISVNSSEPAEVIIYDGIGRTAGTYKMNAGVSSVSTAAYSAGTYHYSLLDKNRKVLSGGTFNVVK